MSDNDDNNKLDELKASPKTNDEALRELAAKLKPQIDKMDAELARLKALGLLDEDI